jgi:hypothetical protein
MRKKLRNREDQRTRFRATFARMGTKPGWRGHPEQTLLLQHIVEVESGQRVTDHLWFNFTKGFRAVAPLTAGDIVEFDARVKAYRKGHWGHDDMRAIENPPCWDYKLSHPTKISKVSS